VPYDFLRIAERMLATPSVSGQGTAELVHFLCRAVVPDLPGTPVLLPEPGGADVNLLLVVGDTGGAGLLLNSHLDTVPPGERRAWTATGGNPYRPRRDGDRLIGLGSADAKLDWLCKAEALRRAAADGPLSRPVYLLGTWGEERGLGGARSFLAVDVVPRPAAALVGEPTECRLVTRHKGLLVGEIRLVAAPRPAPVTPLAARTLRYRGRAAHSAAPAEGESAILKGLADIADETPVIAIRGGDAANRVAAWCEVEVASTRRRATPLADRAPAAEVSPMSPGLFAAVREFVTALGSLAAAGPRDSVFIPPGTTANVGVIEGRGDTLLLTFDLRALPGGDRGALRRSVEGLARDVETAYAGVQTSVRFERDDPPLPPAPASLIDPALAAMAAAGLPQTVATEAGCTEAGLYASNGIPAVVFGAGRARGNIHAPNEWTSVTELERATAFYTAFVRSFCRA
jgi:succinyl-diaminopimelate desuccinylase